MPAIIIEGDRVEALAEYRERCMRGWLLERLDRHDGKVERLARVIGASRAHAYNLLMAHGLHVRRPRPRGWRVI